MILADLGAEVIKIENPTGGDDTRTWGPPFVYSKTDHYKESAYFLGVNRNKRSMTVDFRKDSGREIIRTLAAKSDVFIENYIPGKLGSYGLGYDDLKKINSRLIYTSITGYGSDGPYSKRAGLDVITEAEAGLMHITGEMDENPVKVGVAITDLTTGLYAHGAIMASLIKRHNTNSGQKLDVSLIVSRILINRNAKWRPLLILHTIICFAVLKQPDGGPSIHQLFPINHFQLPME